MSTADFHSAESVLTRRNAAIHAGPCVDELLDSIATDYKLVVDLQTQALYWLGTRFEPDFTPSTWGFFEKLVRNTKQEGRGIDLFDFDGRRRLEHTGFRTKKKRLVDLLKNYELSGLANRIVPFENGYRLKVIPSQIYSHPDLQPSGGQHLRICA